MNKEELLSKINELLSKSEIYYFLLDKLVTNLPVSYTHLTLPTKA